jgi:hypothetical protein
MNILTPLEIDLIKLWLSTETVMGCRANLIALDKLERRAETIEDSDMVKDAMDLLYVKGNIKALEERKRA